MQICVLCSYCPLIYMERSSNIIGNFNKYGSIAMCTTNYGLRRILRINSLEPTNFVREGIKNCITLIIWKVLL